MVSPHSFTRSEVEHIIDPFYGWDPKFDDIARSTAGLRYQHRSDAELHLKYVLRMYWPLVSSFRRALVGQREYTTYPALGYFASGDQDLEYLGAGHTLLEGYPGTGKTFVAKIPAFVFGGTFSRFQGLADKMPSDYTGAYEFDVDENGKFCRRLVRGPAFGNFQLVDEINRNPEKTQGALLESWGEGKVTISGETYDVQPHGIATMNSAEKGGEGTYDVIPTLYDRIMFKLMGEWFTKKHFADVEERAKEFEVIRQEFRQVCTVRDLIEARKFFQQRVYISRELKEDRMGAFAEALNAAHDTKNSPLLKKYVEMIDRPILQTGLWGRGFLHWCGAAKAMAAIRYRSYVTADDALKVAKPILRHRLIFYKGVLDLLQRRLKHRDQGQTIDFLIDKLIQEAW